MKRIVIGVLLSVGLAGCDLTVAQQVHELNQEGVTSLSHRDYAKAERDFQEAVKLAPDDVTSLYNLANTCHQAGEWPQAEQHYRECLQKQPDHAASHHGLALLLVQQNRAPEATQLVDKWLADRPNLADAHAEEGWLLRESGDLPAAQAELHKALHLDHGCVRALIELGLIYEAYSYPERARSLYERALEREPNQVEVLGRLAKMKRGNEAPQ